MVLSQTVEETNVGDLITMTGTRELHTGIVVEKHERIGDDRAMVVLLVNGKRINDRNDTCIS